MTAAITGLKISQPLSNELAVGFSQNVPGKSPAGLPFPAKVGADAEGAARAGDDADPRILVVAEPAERGVEVGAHLAVDRVEGVRPVVGDGGDVAVELVEHGVAHGQGPIVVVVQGTSVAAEASAPAR